LEAGNFKLDQTRTKHWHARRQATVWTQSSLAAQLHRTTLAARPVGIGDSLTLSGNGQAITVTVQHRLSPRAMSMLANVSRMYAGCFDKVLYHVNSRILKCKMTNVITMIGGPQKCPSYRKQSQAKGIMSEIYPIKRGIHTFQAPLTIQEHGDDKNLKDKLLLVNLTNSSSPKFVHSR
jgi:hypothetical protein